MCKIGDIILIRKYKDGKNQLGTHSFIVIDDRKGVIEGLPYDMICNVLSSFKDEEQRKRKLGYDGNFPISHDDTITNPDNLLFEFISESNFPIVEIIDNL